MQEPLICDLTWTNHRTPFILPRFRGVVTKNCGIFRAKNSVVIRVLKGNLERSHRKRGTPHKQPTAILLVNVRPIVMRINYDVKARGKTIRTSHQLVFYSESVSHTDRTIGLVWMNLYRETLLELRSELRLDALSATTIEFPEIWTHDSLLESCFLFTEPF